MVASLFMGAVVLLNSLAILERRFPLLSRSLAIQECVVPAFLSSGTPVLATLPNSVLLLVA